MKQIVLLFLFFATAGFAEYFAIENQTSYPAQKSKIAIQWATSAREVDEANRILMQGLPLNTQLLKVLSQVGKIRLSIPEKAAYFRVLAWSKGEGEPDLHTNWVEIVPNKTYTLKKDHLVPVALMLGTGC